MKGDHSNTICSTLPPGGEDGEDKPCGNVEHEASCVFSLNDIWKCPLAKAEQGTHKYLIRCCLLDAHYNNKYCNLAWFPILAMEEENPC